MSKKKSKKENYRVIPMESHGAYWDKLNKSGIGYKLIFLDDIVTVKSIRRSPRGQTYFELKSGEILHASFFERLNDAQIKNLTRINKIKIIKQYE